MMLAGIKYHHSMIEDPEFTDSTAIISLANGLAHQCGFTNNAPDHRDYS